MRDKLQKSIPMALSFCPGYLQINEENHDKIEAYETDRTDQREATAFLQEESIDWYRNSSIADRDGSKPVVE